MFYVTMTDRFMSGWGEARGKTNKLVIECETMAEAITVEQNARDRDEMKYVNIRSSRPNYPYACVSQHNKIDYSTWFKTDRPFRR